MKDRSSKNRILIILITFILHLFPLVTNKLRNGLVRMQQAEKLKIKYSDNAGTRSREDNTRHIITSIHQPTNAHIISHKTLLNHFKTLRHISILSDHHQGACSLLKLCYSIRNSIRICKRGVVAAYHVVQECVLKWFKSVLCEIICAFVG